MQKSRKNYAYIRTGMLIYVHLILGYSVYVFSKTIIKNETKSSIQIISYCFQTYLFTFTNKKQLFRQ